MASRARTHPAPASSSSPGYSLPELLLAVALLAILAAIALPSGQGALARMRVEAASRGVMLAIERQRQWALRQGRYGAEPGGALQAGQCLPDPTL